jgi:hypothetical protein
MELKNLVLHNELHKTTSNLWKTPGLFEGYGIKPMPALELPVRQYLVS